MRLLHAEKRTLKEFFDDAIPIYAILSHTWGEDEVTFQDILKPECRKKIGYVKINYACEQAIRDNIAWVWVDTCCIDKSSSAELTESINSMYRWYQRANVCYAYLADVSGLCPELNSKEGSLGDDKNKEWNVKFAKSKWFSRGWTLQELIAPSEVRFYNHSWGYIGIKCRNFFRYEGTLSRIISKRTRIEHSLLTNVRTIESFSIAQKMSWASDRTTSRIEDMAYCLLGLFNVNIPLLYGEGERAFVRLQHEIIKESTDQSIFAWGFGDPTGVLHPQRPYLCLPFAPHPSYFQNSYEIVQCPEVSCVNGYSYSSIGLQITLPVLRVNDSFSYAILGCRFGDDLLSAIALCVESYEGHHFITTQSRWRVERVNLQTIDAATKQPLLINTKPNYPVITAGNPLSGLSNNFVLRFSCDGTKKLDFEIIDVYPRDRWNITASSMFESYMRGSENMGAVLLSGRSENLFVVGFYSKLKHGEIPTSTAGVVIDPSPDTGRSDADLWPTRVRQRCKIEQGAMSTQTTLRSGELVFVTMSPINESLSKGFSHFIDISAGRYRELITPSAPPKY